MNDIFLNEESISQLFWKNIKILILESNFKNSLENILYVTKNIRKNFPIGLAGTINTQSALELIAISRYFSPKLVCEVGTYIGRSSLCIVSGAQDNLKCLHTCDYTFDNFKLTKEIIDFDVNRSKINYYGKTSSIEMFRQLDSALENNIDLFFIDGRISVEDSIYIEKLKNKNTIFVLDDYEGTEKGVHNAFILRQQFKNLILIRPSINSLNGEIIYGKIALLVPINNFKITRQQFMPINAAL